MFTIHPVRPGGLESRVEPRRDRRNSRSVVRHREDVGTSQVERVLRRCRVPIRRAGRHLTGRPVERHDVAVAFPRKGPPGRCRGVRGRRAAKVGLLLGGRAGVVERRGAVLGDRGFDRHVQRAERVLSLGGLLGCPADVNRRGAREREAHIVRRSEGRLLADLLDLRFGRVGRGRCHGAGHRDGENRHHDGVHGLAGHHHAGLSAQVMVLVKYYLPSGR